MAANTNLHKAKQAKNDEFYTQLSDVEKELKHYKDHFKDKIVLCNCDDPTYSAFWKYFHLNFSVLGLKRLISTHYSKDHSTYKMEYEGGNDNDVNVGKITPFEGGGTEISVARNVSIFWTKRILFRQTRPFPCFANM